MKLTLLAAALVASMALGASSLRADDMASTSSTTTTTTSSTKMMKTPYKGTITAVDASGMKVTVKSSKGEEMMMMVNDKTKYKGGKALSDFAVGDMVTGSYMKDDSGMTACSIHKKK